MARYLGEEVTEVGRWLLEELLNDEHMVWGPAFVPVLVEVLRGNATSLRRKAFDALRGMGDPSADEALGAALAIDLERGGRTLAQTVELAAELDFARFAEPIWACLGHRTASVRAQAAAAIAGHAEAPFERATGLLAGDDARARAGAAALLGRLGTPEALARVERQFAVERDEDARDAMRQALQAAGIAVAPADESPAALRARLAAVAARVRRLPVRWLQASDLPPLRFADGAPVDAALVRWLLHRQAREKACAAEPEAAPLYAAIDRDTSGDFALHVLQAYLSGAGPSAPPWPLVVAALLGDGRTVTALGAQVRKWADDRRIGRAEFGLRALALHGSDAALAVIDGIARRFVGKARRKYREVGEAAEAAMREAAARLGVPREELAERVVPRFGHEDGEPRVIEAGRRRLRVEIGRDFKLRLRDVDTGRTSASVPKAAPPEVQAELKGARRLLQQVVRDQTARLERALVSARRWDAADWAALYLPHPVLSRFAERLVWGCYDAEGALVATFRALEDRTLTTADDDELGLPPGARVGLAHPIDLDDAARAAWRAHLAEYEVAPPFPQLERMVTRVSDDDRPAREFELTYAPPVGALTLRGRAERLGWNLGPAGDGASVDLLWRRWPGFDIEVFLNVRGLGIFLEPGDEATVESLAFYEADAIDPRCVWGVPIGGGPGALPLGEVPPLVFSEAVYDVARLTEAAP